MGKRKAKPDEVDNDESPSDKSSAEESGSSDDEDSLLDVDFEWFDPQPEHDFHGVKTLLRQLFDSDAKSIDISALTDLILAQPLLGSTVKVDGNESDPYAFLTILNLREHSDKAVIRELLHYLLGRAPTSRHGSKITEALSLKEASVGLILTERLINIPSQVAPPMYKMLLEEINWALDEKEPYDFSHYLILSKVYREVDSLLDGEDDKARKSKKQRKGSGPDNATLFYFHPEDEVLHKYAIAQIDYEYASGTQEGQADSKRAFQELGVEPRGHLILIEADRFSDAVKALQEAFQQV